MIRLHFSTGERLQLDSRVVVGRSPVVHPGDEATRLAIVDPARSISKTHLEVGIDDEGAWVLDRHSMNGTSIVSAGRERRLDPERRARLTGGDVVRFGKASFTVVHVPDDLSSLEDTRPSW